MKTSQLMTCESNLLKTFGAAFKPDIQLWQREHCKFWLYLLPLGCVNWDFSFLLYLKNKYRNVLDPENDLHIALSHKVPRFEQIIAKRTSEKSQKT